MKLKSLLFSTIAIALPCASSIAAQQGNDRWFEVEVILFSQLGDKTELKEQFTNEVTLPSYRRINDLLAPYLNPDIASLKQKLPYCDSLQYPENILAQPVELPALFNPKSLAEIEALSAATDYFYQDSSISTASAATPAESESLPTNTLDSLSATTDNSSIEEFETPAELSDEQRAKIQHLVTQAEQTFTVDPFPYAKQSFATELCQSELEHLGFSVDKVPVTIDGAERAENSNTHLLAQNSLKLRGIVRDLRNSKNFRPLLHLGWRQVARAKNRATAIKLYAGDNFEQDYQQQLIQFNKAQQNLIEQESTLIDANNTEQALLNEIIAQLPHIEQDTAISQALANNQLPPLIERPQQQASISAPVPPAQTWFIEGLFNIHLKHYLFITADFSVLDKSLAELATMRLNTDITASDLVANPIAFKQDRRVISGEIHYFDHPYMGMIVQIRPYKKPKN